MAEAEKAKKTDWTETTMNVAGLALELALTGLVFGITGALGQKLISGSPTTSKFREEGTVVPLRKTGSV